MDRERLRNFKELQAKFQKLDEPSLPELIKFPAGVSQKGDIKSMQSTKILANGKPLSSNHKQSSPYCPSDEPQPLELHKMMLAQRSEIQKCSNSPGPLRRSTGHAVNSKKASLLLDMNTSNAEVTSKKNVVVASTFRDKLLNWEKASSQKSEMPSAFLLANCGSGTFHLEEQKSMRFTLKEPREKLEIKASQTLHSQRHLIQRKAHSPSEDPTFLLSQHGRKSQEHTSPKRNPVASTCQPIYESELTSHTPEKQPNVKSHQLPKIKPLPSMELLGPPPTKPPKPPAVNLQLFQRLTAVSKTYREGEERLRAPPTASQPASKSPGSSACISQSPSAPHQLPAAVEEGYLPPESAELEEPHNYEATIPYLRYSGNSINLNTTEEIADSIYEVGIEELQKPWKSFLHQELSPAHEAKTMKEKEPAEWEPRKTGKALHANHLSKVGASEGTPGKTQMMKAHGGRGNMLASAQGAGIDVIQTKACPKDPKSARYFQGRCVEASALTKETSGQGAFKPSSSSEEMYDDVEYPGRRESKLEISDSFASDNENRDEMYEDIYRTKSNYPNTDLDGKEALKRLQRFFKKEKDRFKMKTKSKENISAFSISLPDLELRSQELIIHGDVNINEKESKDEDKVKTWKPKFLIPKGKQERKGAEESESLSPRNFFRAKKQNLEKKRMEREKLFRERFEYDKEITVINTAVACSSNSRNGLFNLQITPGEEVEVIDVTKDNLLICRNSKGEYGYVLIEHLHFKHQGWSP